MAETERGEDQEQTKKGCLDLCRPAAVLEHLKGAKFVFFNKSVVSSLH